MFCNFSALPSSFPSTQQSLTLIEELKMKEMVTASNILLNLLNERRINFNGPLLDFSSILSSQIGTSIAGPQLGSPISEVPLPSFSPTTSTGTISPSTSSVDGSVNEVEDDRPYKCPECLKRFRFKSNLFEHRSLHQQSTPFVCPFCSKTCRLKGNLKKHLAVHVGSSAALEELWKARFSRSSGRPRKQPSTQHPILHQQQLPKPNPYPTTFHSVGRAVGAQEVLIDFNSLSAFRRF